MTKNTSAVHPAKQAKSVTRRGLGELFDSKKQSGYSYSPVNGHRQAIFTALSLIFEAGLIPLRVAIFIFVLKILKDFCFYHCFNSPSRVRFKVMVVSGISNSSLAKSVYEPVNIALKKIHVGLRTSILAELP